MTTLADLLSQLGQDIIVALNKNHQLLDDDMEADDDVVQEKVDEYVEIIKTHVNKFIG